MDEFGEAEGFGDCGVEYMSICSIDVRRSMGFGTCEICSAIDVAYYLSLFSKDFNEI